MQKRPILVIGGAGYIGSHVCLSLAANGFLPICYDNLSTGHAWAVQWGPLVTGDLRDPKTLRSVIRSYQPSAVIHLASLISVRDSIQEPISYYEENFGNTLGLVKVMLEEKVHRLIFASTAAIYGKPQYTPLDEAHPKAPLNPYGKSKWMVEQMLEDVAKSSSLRFVTLRFFNAAGADSMGRIGEAHTSETHLIPLTIFTALKIQEHLKIYGDQYPTEDGTAIRDYVHVKDLARAHLMALRYLLLGHPSLQINIGAGRGYSVKQIVEQVERICEYQIPVEIVAPSVYDSPELIADISEARKVLGFEPKFSSISTILQSAWRWHQKQKAQTILCQI